MRVLVLALLVCAASACPTVVRTRLGWIRGLQATDGDYNMFLGIPYAEVDNANPFGPSQPYPRFEKVFNAFDDSAICPQQEEFNRTVTGTLDCLHLNVYVPNKANSTNRLPVLVWIYGGGFQFGFAGRLLYGPKYLVRHDIILVTVNYRVGPYGFMCLGTPDVPGNQGLKDQVSALRWIKSNIDAFGGDESDITVFGESAGGMSVDLHLLSDNEKLFDKAIMQSGAALYPGLVRAPDANPALQLARHLGMETDDVSAALAFLTKAEPCRLIAASLELSLSFMPCVEKPFDGVDTFLNEYPVNSAITKAKKITILAGYNDHEMLPSYYFTPADEFPRMEKVFKTLLNINFDLSQNKKLTTSVRQFYIGDEDLSADLKWDLIDVTSDFLFNYPTHRSLKKYLENNDKAVYHYIFSYTGGRNFVKRRLNMTEGGAAHADEIAYLFDVSLFEETPSAKDQLAIDRITTMWANFVKYGDPTPETSELLPVKWEPITEDVYAYLDIGSDLTVGRRPFHCRMAYWDLFYEMYKNLQWGYRDQE